MKTKTGKSPIAHASGGALPPQPVFRRRAVATASIAAFTVALHAVPAAASCLTVTGPGVYILPLSYQCVTWTPSAGDSLTVASTATISGAATGLDATGALTASALFNNGTIDGTSYGILNSDTIGTLANSGTINSNSVAVFNQGGNITTFANNSGAVITGGSYGLANSGAIGTVINNGSISGAVGIDNSSSGHIGTLINNGIITGTTASGSAFGVFNYKGTIGTITNENTITGDNYGVNNDGSITSLTNDGQISTTGTSAILNNGTDNGDIGRLTNGGSIIGTVNGIDNSGTIGALTNTSTGAITAGTNAIQNSGQITLLTNAGQMTASIGIANSGTISSLVNTGIISGRSYAINNASGGSLASISNAGEIDGNIMNASSNGLTISGGSGSIVGILTGFGRVTGTITNTNSDLTFSSGNLLLDDSINVGSHTVKNTGSALEVDHALTITGNYNQGQAATLLVGVSSGATATGSLTDTGYGRLVVTGDATIAAGSSVTLKGSGGYGFAAGQRYVVVDASGTGTYNASTLNYAILGATGLTVTGATAVSGGHSDLVLTLATANTSGSATSGSGTASSGTTGSGTTGSETTISGSSVTSSPTPQSSALLATVPNAIRALHGLFSYTGVEQLQLLNLYDATLAAADQGSTADANRIGQQLGPQQMIRAAAAPTLDVVNIVNAHVNSLRTAQAQGATGIATGDSPPRWTAWGQFVGGHASQGERDNVDGYSANYGGLLIGADRSVSENWRAGGAFEYTHTAIDNSGGTAGDSTGVNAYGLFGYASYTGSPWYVNLSAGAVLQHYDTTRLVNMTGFSGVANGSFDGQQYVTRAEAGYPLAIGGATLTPLASVAYSHLYQDSYTETGGNGAALSVGHASANSVQTALGVALSKVFETSYGALSPELRVQWIHEYEHSPLTTGASFAGDLTRQTAFTTVGQTPISNLADVSLGVTLLRANNLSLSARYELQAGSGFLSNSGVLRLQQQF